MKRLIISLAIVFVMSAGLAINASAQYYWMNSSSDYSISLDIYKPSFDRDGIDFLTTVWFLSGKFEIGKNVGFYGEIPITYLDVDNDVFDDMENETAFGNPYLGLEFKFPTGNGKSVFVTRAGFRPPVISYEKRNSAEFAYTAMYNRLEAFLPEDWTLNGGFGYNMKFENMMNLDFNVNGALIIPKEDNYDTEFLLNYNLNVGYASEKAMFSAGIGGSILMTNTDLDLAERMETQLGMKVGLNYDKLHPNIQVRVPVEERLSNYIKMVIGLGVSYDL